MNRFSGYFSLAGRVSDCSAALPLIDGLAAEHLIADRVGANRMQAAIPPQGVDGCNGSTTATSVRFAVWLKTPLWSWNC